MHFNLCMLYLKKNVFKNININIDINIIHIFLPKYTLFAWDAFQVSEVTLLLTALFKCFACITAFKCHKTRVVVVDTRRRRKVKGTSQDATTALYSN